MNYYETYMMAINIADDGDHERNAKHHSFWQISMFQKFGKTFAQGIGDVHRRGCPGTAEDNRVNALKNVRRYQFSMKTITLLLILPKLPTVCDPLDCSPTTTMKWLLSILKMKCKALTV